MATDTAAVTITIEPRPPLVSAATVTITTLCEVIANDDTATLTEPGVAIPDVKANDDYCSDSPLIEAVTDIPPELEFDPETGQVTLLPGAEPGTYAFDYTLTDSGSEDTATATVIYEPPVEVCYPPVCSCTIPC